METRTVHDPFVGKDVQISDRLVDRLRGKYASGPHLPNGNPEFGWKQFQSPPIQHEAAARIEELEAALTKLCFTARVLLQNAEGCAVNHHGADYYLHGEPGWLKDCRTTIEAAEAVQR